MNITRLSLAIAAALACVAAGAPAQAQEVPAREEARRLDEVTVSARRREESAQDVPVAVTAFSREDLVELQADSIEDLQGSVPNLNIVQGRGSSGSVNVFIRGIGQPDALQSFDPGVGMYVDDVYYSRIQGALFSLYDIERVEVLRGPQGTLYGKNSTGGAIKLGTRMPGAEPEATAELTVGDYGRVEGQFFGAVPLGPTAGFSFAAASLDNGGYVTDPVTGKDYNNDNTGAFRAKLAWQPSDRFQAVFAADYTDQDTALTLGQPTAPLIQFDLATGVRLLRLADAGEYDFETRTSFPTDRGQQLQHSGVSAALTWGLAPGWTFKSISAGRSLETSAYIDIDASEFELGDVLVELDQDQFSQEFQFQYQGDRWDALFGLYYLNEDVPSHQEAYAHDFLAFNTAPISFVRTIDDDLETTSYAAFAHATWRFAPTWSLAGGVRYTQEDKDYFRTTSTFSSLAPLNGSFAFRIDDSWDAVTPSVSIQKELGATTMIYGSASRGFKSGGFNGRANSPGEVSTFDPEYVWTYELGLKWTSEDGRLLANLAAFHSDYEDFQARVSEIVDPNAPIPTFSFPVLNAAELSIDGVEFEGVALIGDATRISANVGWLDAQYDTFIDPRVELNPALADLHAQVPFSPEWTARLAATHSFYFEPGTLTVGADAAYRDEVWLSVDNRPGLMQDAYTLVGLFGIWDSADLAWQVRAGVRNLTDEVYKTEGQEFSSVGNIQTAYYGWPRHYYLSLRYNF